MGFTKYICYHCDNVFDEQDAGWDCEMIGEGSMRGPQWYNTCPNCGSDEIYEAQTCPICGEAYGGTEDYCDNCLEYIAASFTDYIRNLQLALGTDYKTTLEAVRYEAERRA